MSWIFGALVALAAAAQTCNGAITNLVVSNLFTQRATTTLHVAGGESAKLVAWAGAPNGGPMSGPFELVQIIDGIRVARDFQLNATLFGPCIIEFAARPGGPDGSYIGLVTLDIDSVVKPLIPLVPSSAVVVPADSAGPVTILLESSVDLVTWTSALPGQYGSNTVRRFFRVRAVYGL